MQTEHDADSPRVRILTHPRRSADPAARPATLTIRARRSSDSDALVAELAQVQVHESDSYPMMATHVSHAWLYDPGFEAAWVAERDGRVLGHIAVARGYGGTQVQAATGQSAADTLCITRFFVGHCGRGTGAAPALLGAVDDYAATRGLALALEVIDINQAAIALYERRGWQHVGCFTAEWFGADGPHPTVQLYVGPGAPAPPADLPT